MFRTIPVSSLWFGPLRAGERDEEREKEPDLKFMNSELLHSVSPFCRAEPLFSRAHSAANWTEEMKMGTTVCAFAAEKTGEWVMKLV